MPYSVERLKPSTVPTPRANGAAAPTQPLRLISAAAPPQPHLSTEVAMAGEATGQLRAFLTAHGLGDWGVFCCNANDLGDVEQRLAELGEADAYWEPNPHTRNGGEQPVGLSRDDAEEAAVCHRPGFLWLKRHEVVIARWFFLDLRHHAWFPFHLFAAAEPDRMVRLRAELVAIRREQSRGKWQVYSSDGWRDADEPRHAAPGAAWDGLVLDPAVKQRLEAEVVGFFREPVAHLYRELDIPYRRGLLLYGPPGNGKTSLIRVIGGLNPDVPGLLLRPGEDFNDGELSGVIETWCRQAPAILVIEDLDWLFHSARLNVSTFLNMLDGVDRRDGGLLLIATSNHPESLDPAINNRPGRFDVAIEVTSPDRALRLEFFRRSRLGIADPKLLEKLAGMTDGLSFSHLREIESLSGLNALQAGRNARTEQDVLRAAATVAQGYEKASRGFPEPAAPFGLLGQLRANRGE